MVKVKFSNHFWEKWKDRKEFMEKQGVTIEELKHYIHEPDMVMQDDIFPNREWRIKKIGGRCLKVVVEIADDEIIVITAYFDRALRRKGLCG